MDYQQPHFYKFNSDSISLSNLAIQYSKDSCDEYKTLLDLGCGCGVVGIEVANQLNTIEYLSLVEVQQDYQDSIQFNLQNLLIREVENKTSYKSFSQIGEQLDETFDLIVCNPPYFTPGKGRKSSNVQRQICRTFEMDSPQILMKLILNSLSEKGKAFILMPKAEIQWQQIKDEYHNNIQKLSEESDIEIYLVFHPNSN